MFSFGIIRATYILSKFAITCKTNFIILTVTPKDNNMKEKVINKIRISHVL